MWKVSYSEKFLLLYKVVISRENFIAGESQPSKRGSDVLFMTATNVPRRIQYTRASAREVPLTGQEGMLRSGSKGCHEVAVLMYHQLNFIGHQSAARSPELCLIVAELSCGLLKRCLIRTSLQLSHCQLSICKVEGTVKVQHLIAELLGEHDLIHLSCERCHSIVSGDTHLKHPEPGLDLT